MTEPHLHLVRMPIDSRALSTYATAKRFLDDDLGYALHFALRATFGAAAPQPFRLMPSTTTARATDGLELLGYSRDAEALLAERPSEVALPDWNANWDETAPESIFAGAPTTRPMPNADQWSSSRSYDFEVLTRPVRRHGSKLRALRRSEGKSSTGQEHDAYLSAIEGLEAGEHSYTRQSVYAEWLEQRLAPAAKFDGPIVLRQFRRTRVIRSRHDQGRMQSVEGPEALLGGTLKVLDGEAFDALLGKGVGRHGAFGLGMLLLKTVRR